MRQFLSWGAALITHWIALLGGAAVSVALLVFAYYMPTASIPPMVWWVGVVGGFVLASFATWQEQHVRANQLAIVRPEFAPKYAGIEQSQDTSGKPLPDQFLIRFWFHNASGIPVRGFRRKLLVVHDFSKPPLDVNTSENANNVYTDINLRAMLTHIPKNAGPHYFAVMLDYQDARNRHPYSQAFYYVWMGSGTEQFWMGFHDATIKQRDKMHAYMKSRNLISEA